MNTEQRAFAIGDIQGCLDPLLELLDKLDFTGDDQIWFVGDLVNRGPKSLETLRFIKNLGSRARVVLGNHDLFLLSVAYGNKKLKGKKDTIDDILKAKDKIELIEWLRHQHLLIEDPQRNLVMVHAGIPPQWDLATAVQEARRVEEVLRSSQAADFLVHKMFGSDPQKWRDDLSGIERIRYGVNAFTRMRYATSSGELEFKAKAVTSPSKDFMPWFAHAGRACADTHIVFGHWSALKGDVGGVDKVYALDTGCLWGGRMTALNLDNKRQVYVPCKAYQQMS